MAASRVVMSLPMLVGERPAVPAGRTATAALPRRARTARRYLHRSPTADASPKACSHCPRAHDRSPINTLTSNDGSGTCCTSTATSSSSVASGVGFAAAAGQRQPDMRADDASEWVGVQRPGHRIGSCRSTTSAVGLVASPSWAANVSNNERVRACSSSPNSPWTAGNHVLGAGIRHVDGRGREPATARRGLPRIWRGAATATDDTTDRRNATAAPRPNTCTTRIAATNSGNDDLEP